MTLVAEKKIVIKDLEFFILLTMEEDGKNVETIEKFIKYLNEKPTNNLRTMDVIDRIVAIIEISKMIYEEVVRVKFEECLGNPLKSIVAFDSDFDRRMRAGLPSYWDVLGSLFQCE